MALLYKAASRLILIYLLIFLSIVFQSLKVLICIYIMIKHSILNSMSLLKESTIINLYHGRNLCTLLPWMLSHSFICYWSLSCLRSNWIKNKMPRKWIIKVKLWIPPIIICWEPEFRRKLGNYNLFQRIRSQLLNKYNKVN